MANIQHPVYGIVRNGNVNKVEFCMADIVLLYRKLYTIFYMNKVAFRMADNQTRCISHCCLFSME